MSNGGLSKNRLDQMHNIMAGYVDRGEVPGIVTMISRHGETHVDAIGTTSIDGKKPVKRDTIFRISSMTKPITAVATMILIEQCKLRLDEPVDHLLPELSTPKVLKKVDGDLEDTELAKRSITVRDLLTLRMGTGIIVSLENIYPIQNAMSELKLGQGPPEPDSMPNPDEWLKRLGSLPLIYNPGDKWMYNTGFDVLGVLIARASGQSLETFFHENIFEPLEMLDTGFYVPKNKLDRFTSSYMVNPETNGLELYDKAQGQWSHAPDFPSGAAGLVSTVDDYLSFGQMLLNKGKYRNKRILSRPSVDVMTSNQINKDQTNGTFFPKYFENHGWGFGVSMVTKHDDISSIPGRFGWDGGLGTSWWSDPKEDLVGILMTQRNEFPLLSKIYLDFWTSVYQSIND
jgi:CubicO group peptidase (beta-lactamase class C family)